jgi:hypothetical protein
LKFIDAQTLADRVDLNLELLLEALATASLKRLVVDEILGFIDKQFKHIFNFLVLILDVAVVLVTTGHI